MHSQTCSPIHFQYIANIRRTTQIKPAVVVNCALIYNGMESIVHFHFYGLILKGVPSLQNAFLLLVPTAKWTAIDICCLNIFI
ncbi:hypothetical protein V1520DRAFT_332997 [Lipomyces starkeyi]